MSRVLKILAAVVVTILVVFALALIWLTWFFDIGAYRDEIVGKTQAYTGRDITVDGDISLTAVPRLSLRIGDVKLAQRSGFGDAPMVDVESLEVVVQWLPLLRGEVLIDHIELNAPRLELGIGGDGTTAWGDIVSRATRVNGQNEIVSDDQALAAGFAVLAIQGLVIRDGIIHWRDERDQSSHVFRDIEFDIERISHRERGDFSFGARVESTLLERDTHIALSGGVQVDFQNLDARLNDIELTLDDGVLNASLEVSVINAVNIRQGPELSLSDIEVSAGFGDLSIQLDSPDVTYRHDDEIVSVDSLAIQGPGFIANGAVMITDVGTSATMDLRLEMRQLDIARLLDAAQIDPSQLDANTFKDASMGLEMVADSRKARINVRNFVVAESELSAIINVQYGDPPMIQVTVDSERLDLDSLFVDSGDPASNTAIPLAAPLYALHGVEGGIQAHIASLVSGGITFDDLRISAVSDSQGVVLDPLTARVAGGELSIMASIGKDAVPPMSIRFSMRDSDAGQLLGALGVTDRLSGTGSVEISLDTVGLEYDDIVGTLDGRVLITLRDGRIQGIDIGRILAAARGNSASSASSTGVNELQTPFSKLSTEFRFKDGVGESHDAELLATDFRVRGDGVLDLPRDRIDYRLAIFLAKAGDDAQSSSPVEYETIPIPLRVRGAIGKPEVSLDVEALMKSEAERKIQREAERRGIDAPSGRDALREYLRRELEQRLE
jgi:AsmA protein